MSRGRSFFGWGGVGRGVLAVCLAALLVSSCATTAEDAVTITAGGAAEPSKQPGEPASDSEPEDDAGGEDQAPQDESQGDQAPGDEPGGDEPGGDEAGGDEAAPGDISSDLVKIAEFLGISYETAKKNQQTQELLRPYIRRVREARAEEFAGFWWSGEQPLTAVFATAGDVEDFTRFVFDTVADLDPEVQSIVRIVQAAHSLKELDNLWDVITPVLRSRGFVFYSHTDVINGKLVYGTTPDQAAELSAAIADAIASLPDAEAWAQTVTVKSGDLPEPDIVLDPE